MADLSAVCGVDEAGRGPIAGPVYAAAVLLAPDHGIDGLTDSKLLSAKKRDALAVDIRRRALSWAVAIASVEEIDRLNIRQASLLAMRRALEQITPRPVYIRVDGRDCPDGFSDANIAAVIQGDRLIAAISAASILAKTERDHHMLELHARFPEYDLARHKGYPTAAHLSALERHGPSSVHRRTFRPVARLLDDAARF